MLRFENVLFFVFLILLSSGGCRSHSPGIIDTSQDPVPNGGAISEGSEGSESVHAAKSTNKSCASLNDSANILKQQLPLSSHGKLKPTSTPYAIKSVDSKFLRRLSQKTFRRVNVIHEGSIVPNFDVHDLDTPDAEDYMLGEFEDGDDYGHVDWESSVNCTHRGIIENDFTERRHDWVAIEAPQAEDNGQRHMLPAGFLVGWLLFAVFTFFQFNL